MPQLLTIILIFFAVLALVGVAFWLTRFNRNRLGAGGNRGRMPRLAIIDAMSVDQRRRLVLVRRDNVEHLLMIGGPSDVVIEPNIVRAMPQRDQMATRGPVGADLPPRVAPLPDAPNWSDQLDAAEPEEPTLPELPPRPARPSFADEVRRAAPAAERRPDPLAAIAAELPPLPRRSARTADPVLPRSEPPAPRSEPPLSRSEPVIPRSESVIPRAEPAMPRGDITMPRSEPAMPRSEPAIPRGEPVLPRSEPPIPRSPAPIEAAAKAPVPPRVERERPVPPPAAAPSSAALSAADQNLAEMAQRLEAALRKPAGDSSVTDRAPSVAPEPPSRPAPRPADVGAPPSPRNENAAPPVAPPIPKSSAFENLEDEMASLLGRPKSPT